MTPTGDTACGRCGHALKFHTARHGTRPPSGCEALGTPSASTCAIPDLPDNPDALRECRRCRRGVPKLEV